MDENVARIGEITSTSRTSVGTPEKKRETNSI
jgi:hypothetical protein